MNPSQKSPVERLRDIADRHNLAPSGYTIASEGPLEIKQVLVIGGLRYVVIRELTEKEFLERIAANASRREHQARELGFVSPGKLELDLDGSMTSNVRETDAPDPSCRHFYQTERLDP